MQKINQNLSDFSTTCVDNSTKIQEKSDRNQILTENTQENSVLSTHHKENEAFSEENSVASNENSENTEKSEENPSQSKENSTKSTENTNATSFEEQIDRDFSDFEVIYPNLSKNSLLGNESLRIFAEGKENKPLSVVYAKFCALCEKISKEAILQEKARQNNASSSLGALSSTKSSSAHLFTREQVKAMSSEEIKRNYDLIRQSQQSW